MTTSTTPAKPEKPRPLRRLARWWRALVWLLLWQLGAMALNQKILLVSPVQVVARLWQLLPQGEKKDYAFTVKLL